MTLLLIKATVNSIVFPKTVFTSAVHVHPYLPHSMLGENKTIILYESTSLQL